LSVAEPRRGVSVGAFSCLSKKRDGGQCVADRARVSEANPAA